MSKARRSTPVAEFAVALLVCGAVHYFFVGPIAARAEEVRREADALAVNSGAGVALTADQLTAMTENARAAARLVAERAALALDETRLFTSIMSLADSTGVRVDQMQPLEVAPVDRAAAAPPPPTTTPGPPAHPETDSLDRPTRPSIGYTITLSAPFAGVIDFMHRLRTELGFTVVRSARLSPADDSVGDRVEAVITTEHYAFDCSALEQIVTAPTTQTQPSEGSR